MIFSSSRRFYPRFTPNFTRTEMVDINAILNLVETIGILVGVTVAVMEIRKTRIERRYQAASQIIQLPLTGTPEHLASVFRNSDFTTYEEWLEKYGPISNPEAYRHWNALWNYYDMMGKNVIDGFVDLDMVINRLEPMVIVGLWEKYSIVIHAWRKNYNYQRVGEGVEFLYNMTKKKYPEVTFKLGP